MTKLDQLQATYDAATGGPWESRPVPDMKCIVIAEAGKMHPHAHVTPPTAQYQSLSACEYANAAFITQAYNAMPDLLAAVRTLHTIANSPYDTQAADLIDAARVALRPFV